MIDFYREKKTLLTGIFNVATADTITHLNGCTMAPQHHNKLIETIRSLLPLLLTLP